MGAYFYFVLRHTLKGYNFSYTSLNYSILLIEDNKQSLERPISRQNLRCNITHAQMTVRRRRSTINIFQLEMALLPKEGQKCTSR